MKRKYILFIVVLLIFTFINLNVPASIASVQLLSSESFGISNNKKVLISEVQTGSESSASDEFVEIYNGTDQEISLQGWSLYYKSSSGSTWSKKATVESGKIVAAGFWVFSTNIIGNTKFSSTFSQAGGTIQIRDSLGEVVDQFGWGSSNSPLGNSAIPSEPGSSMYRIYDFELSSMTNTDNNLSDFTVTNTTTPGLLPENFKEDEKEKDNDKDNEPDNNDSNPPLEEELYEFYPELSELFPDPVTPLNDSKDEFIEIYNPNNQKISLDGWTVRDASGKEYRIAQQSIEAKSYVSLFVNETKITLNNTGDVVQLVNPKGEIIDESADYGTAEPGLSWIKSSEGWVWAQSPTPNGINSQPATLIKADSKNTKKATAKKSSTKKATSKKPASPKKSKLKAAKASSKKDALAPNASEKTNSGIWGWLLLAAGLATISYGIYEYRTEIYLSFKKLKSKFGARS